MANMIKVVKGNVLRLNIPLQVKIRNTEEGEPTERTEDFYPSLEYPVVVKLTTDYKTVSLTAEVDGNVVKVEDKGTLKTGCYQVEVICQDDNGNPYRFAEPCVIHVVNYTKDADIEAGVEYEVETYTLEGAYFIQGEKGDKGDPFTWEDFTEEEILLLQKPARDKANEVSALQEQWTEAEKLRSQADILRQQAEQGREQAEGTRQTAEGQRNTSEGQRQTNEQARSEAETLRQQAERKRQQDTQTTISNAEQATLEAEQVNAQLSSDGGVVILTITNRQGNRTSKEVGFRIYKTYPSVAAMNADLANVEEGRFVMIAGSTEDVDTGKLYVRGASAFTFITDLSGAQGIKGDTGNGIASVTLNADYTLTIVFTDGTSTTTTSIKGEKGDKGDPGTTDYNELVNKPDLSGFITISVNNLVNYYLKSETYTKQEVQALIAAIQQFHYEIYASTSDVTSPQGNVLYLIGPTGTGADKYEEYVYANSQFVKIGDTTIDLSGYYTSQQTDSAISQALNTALADYTTTANLTTLLAGKQDALVSGTNIKTLNGESILGSGNMDIIGCYTPTLSNAPTSSTTAYIKDGKTINFEIGQFCRVPNINGIYTFYQLYDLVIDGNTTTAVWQEVLVDGDFSLAITVLGANNIPQFDPDEPYSVGAFVMNNGFLYKFTSPHTSGEPWNPQEVQQTNLVKEIDQMSKLDYEQVTINVEDEQGQPIEDVEVVVDVEGETSARNLITDAQGRCTTNVQKGLEYTIEVNTPAGYQHTGQIWHRASLPARMIPITLLEDTTSQYEHLKVTLSYSDSSLGVADHILVSYDGVDYSAPVANNVAEFDIPLGKTYTVSFPDIEGYIAPRSRTRVAEFGRTYELYIWYHAAIAGIRWLMNDGSEKELNEATLGDYNNIFGLIVNVSELANANTGYIIPLDVMVNGGGSGNWLSANEGIDSMENFTSHAAALTDLDGEQNCQKIRDHIAYQAAVGITRTSGIAQTVYNRCGGVGVKPFANNVDYAVGALVSYQNMIYRFTTAHKGNWNAAHVEEYGVGYIMPSGELQRCFQVAYGQIYPYRVVFQQVRDFMATAFGVTPVNVASGYWCTSTQFSDTIGVMLLNGGFNNNFKTNGCTLLPALAY